MKTYSELTPEQQLKAIKHQSALLLSDIITDAIRFNDKLNGDDLQKRIDDAMDRAESMHTPWFAGEYIMDTCREEIEGMAQVTAEDALYSEDEYVIPISDLK